MYTAAPSDRRIVVIGKAHEWSPQMVVVLTSGGTAACRIGGLGKHIHVYIG